MALPSPRGPCSPLLKGVKHAGKATAINLFISEEVLEGGEKKQWESLFKSEVPALEEEEKREWASKLDGVACSSNVFFLFLNNVHCAQKGKVTYLAAPSRSVMDKECVKVADEHGVVFTYVIEVVPSLVT